MRSALPTEVPPNFITMRLIGAICKVVVQHAEWDGPAEDRSGLLPPDQFSVNVDVVDDDDARAGLGSVVNNHVHGLYLAARGDGWNHLRGVGGVNAQTLPAWGGSGLRSCGLATSFVDNFVRGDNH